MRAIPFREETFHNVNWGVAKELQQPFVLLPELSAEPTINPGAVADALDSQLEATRAQLCAIAAYRNLFVPISRLGDDILCEIFNWVVREYPQNTPAFRDWSYLMLVCRRWRIIAISNPILWRHIYVGGEQRDIWPSRLYTQRSGVCPLTVVVDLQDVSPATATKIIQSTREVLEPHFDRIQTLIVGAATWDLEWFLGFFGAGERRALRKLVLAVNDAQNARPLVICSHGSWTVQNVVSGASMVTYDVVVDWDHLRNLTQLRISHSNRRPLHYSALISMLRRSPALEWLMLHNCIDFSQHNESWDQVDLPCLKVCDLHESAAICTAIMSGVRFPPVTRVSLRLSTGEHFAGMLALFAVLRAHFDQSKAPTLRALQIRHFPAQFVNGSYRVLDLCTTHYRWYTGSELDDSESDIQFLRDRTYALSLQLPPCKKASARVFMQKLLQSALTENVELCDWRYTLCVEDLFPDVLPLLPALHNLVVVYYDTDPKLWLGATRRMIESSAKADTTKEDRSPKKSIYWLGRSIDDFDALAKLLEMFNGTTAIDFAARRPVERIVFHPQLEGKASGLVTMDAVIGYIKTSMSDHWTIQMLKLGIEYSEMELIEMEKHRR
ncbi:hypothetical protein K525DRAFT_267242 [Schizophyllum commune Loenen D]|nr:hypothetical protein K525DRAFT_267242 [Schizophyllum commune Loenen D]